MTWTSGMDICRYANEACFHRLVEGGFVVEYRDEQSKELSDDGERIEPGDYRYIHVRIVIDGQEVSRGNFSLKLQGPPSLHAQHVSTDEPFQRKGLMSAKYRFVELLTGQTIQDFWHSGQLQKSEAAKALWASLKRPFGHRPLSPPAALTATTRS